MNSQKTNVSLKPIRGKEQDLLELDVVEGALLIATDTGKMYMDANGKRVSVGGSGSPFIYAEAEGLEPDEYGTYTLSFDDLESEDMLPQVDGLIINSDGTFFRILEVNAEEQTMLCMIIAVSGTGGGGGTGAGKAIAIKGKPLKTVSLVNGQKMSAFFTATSATYSDGSYMDEDELTITWSLSVTATGVVYDSGTFKVKNNKEKEFEFGSRLRESTGSTLSLYATGVNSGKSRIITYEVTTVELLLYESEKFSNVAPQNGTFTYYCNVSGAVEKILDFYLDGVLVESQNLSKTSTGEQKCTFKNVSHGYHTVTVNLSQSIDGDRGVGVKEPLEFEIAVNNGGTDPIIWLGKYESEYYSYDPIKIPYRVFDPNPTGGTKEVVFVKGIAEIGSRQEDISATKFSIWQITDATLNIENSYSIRVEKSVVAEGDIKYVSRDIKFNVAKDPNRDLSIVEKTQLLLSFDAAGRSNNETEVQRQTWSYVNENKPGMQPIVGEFKGFNWYNNGWLLDENNDTMLRISNGAKFVVPIGSMVLNNPANANQQSRTFEFQFKIRNVQDYTNLIKEYTRYSGDLQYWNAFLAQLKEAKEGYYDNYDNYLRNELAKPDATTTYDKLSENFAGIERVVSGNTPFCSYYDSNGRGFLLGPQDGFFASAENILNVRYVEGQMVNLSVVFSYTDHRIYFYLQGILTAVCKITDTGALEIGASAIEFNSQYCDVDLYKMRIYDTALSVRDILINFSVDHSSVLDYDHTTRLISYNQNTGEYQLNYASMIEWNDDVEHTDSYLMPYIVFDTGSFSNRLPYSKADKKVVGVTFVNTGLDRAYKNGTLEELANQMTATQKAAAADEGLSLVQYYYKYHCPSFISRENKVNIAVQGTSSQFYPRRNYKIKFKGKDANGKDYIYMFMNKGPFAELYAAGIAGDEEALKKCHLEFFHYNNYTVGTNKFTMKIDFMESSGTYNMGLANLVHSAYDKHPTDDYNKAGAFAKVSYKVSNEPTANLKLQYFKDSKGSKKVTFTDQEPYVPGKYYLPEYTPYTFPAEDVIDFRTNVQGFPVMAFWKYGETDNDYRFIGRYNMLVDKGSDEIYNFKPSKSITNVFGKVKKGVQTTVRKMTECWEFSDNQRTFCSFRDPQGRYRFGFDFYVLSTAETYNPKLSYFYDDCGRQKVTFSDDLVYEPNKYYTRSLNAKGSCPAAADSFEYRYNDHEDFLDYIYDPVLNGDVYNDLLGDYSNTQLADIDFRSEEMFDIYKNWEKACQWVWSTCTDNVPTEAERLAGKEARLIMDYEEAKGTEYNEGTQYYNKFLMPIKQSDIDREVIGGIVPAGYYVGTPTPVTYDNKTYIYDTKEYRNAKFTNELAQHFDLQYCLVYFIMTEVLLLYDSRGKNCMMASWGPHSADGDYIWYPIFYDADTQLGINNTGIPSFDYSENATIDGTFSTSDSVLWNNLYHNFFQQITAKYSELRHEINNSRFSGKGPLYNVDHIEKWYLADADEAGAATKLGDVICGDLEMRGDRPLCMFNMDEWYKYISITNENIQYQDGTGGLSTDTAGTYFYALQGDRSLSRQQFLARRLSFVDSWLGEGDFSRSGANGNAIHGRFGANTANLFSDVWVTEKASDNEMKTHGLTVSPYYKTDSDGNILKDDKGYGIKTNYLDADFFVELLPYQKSYVTLGTDTEAYPSIEYKDKPVRYEVPEGQKEGVLKSPNLSESLIYVYGPSALKDIGDISLMYWSEFYAENAPHLERILLGNDHPSFYNKALKTPGFNANPSDKGGGKPLLKEVNMSGVQLVASASKNYDFTSCEKMEIFKAVRSNIASVKFADGVALHTLYLPASVTSLKLVEAENLDTILDFDMGAMVDAAKAKADGMSTAPFENAETNEYYSTYVPNDNKWNARKGLYIEGLTNVKEVVSNSTSCNLSQLELAGGSLGYGSYDLVNKLYRIFKYGDSAGQKDLKLSLTNVAWSPYKKLEVGTMKVAGHTYYTDNGHYGFKQYSGSDANWNTDLLNGEVYDYNPDLEEDSKKITDIQMLIDFINESQFKNTTSTGLSVPVITGSIYVENEEPVDEDLIRNTLLSDRAFPGAKLDIHFKNVTPGYTATFMQLEPDGTYTIIDKQVLPSSTISSKNRFSNPYTLYEAKRDNYDFHGWSTTNDDSGIITESEWNTSDRTKVTDTSVHDYTFYAVFTRHEFQMTFMSGTVGNFTEVAHEGVLFGDYIPVPSVIPALDESELADDERYRFLGWTQDKNAVLAPSASKAKVVNVSSIQATVDTTFYAVFVKESVYDAVTDSKYFEFITSYYEDTDNSTYSMSGYEIQVKPGVKLSGKVTLPVVYNNKPIVGIAYEGFVDQTGITHIYFARDEVNACEYRAFGMLAFSGCVNLKHIEFPENLRTINESCFTRCQSLVVSSIGNKIYRIQSNAFNQALTNPVGQTSYNITLGGGVKILGSGAFSNNRGTLNKLTIGSSQDPSQLYQISEGAVYQNQGQELRSLEIYCTSDRQSYFSGLTFGASRSDHFQVASADAVSIIVV